MQPNNKPILSNNNYLIKNTNNNIINKNNNNNNPIIHHQPRNHSSAAQACAACKHQRRKCTPDCVLAPYFPHDRQRQFMNAHRLFGVSNIVKIVKNLQPAAKDHAMRTIIFQSDARAADPVGGCYRIIQDLEQRIYFANAELDIVHHHLAMYRATAHQAAADGKETKIGWDVLENYNNNNEKLGGQFVVEDGASSWGCMGGNNNQVHGTVESTPSLLPNLVSKVSLEECNGEINGNLDQSSCNDDAKKECFKFDFNGCGV